MDLVKTIKSNILIFLIAAILLVLIGFLVGKAAGNNQNEIDALQNEYDKLKKSAIDKDRFIGELNNELFDINNNLNSISFDSIAIAGLDNPQVKIDFLDSLLEVSSNKIKRLEGIVANDKSGETAKLLQTIVNDLEKRLIEKETLISQLSIENDLLVDENNILEAKVSNLTQAEIALRNDIQAQRESLDRLKDELSDTQENLNKSYTQAQLDRANIYFDSGMEKLNKFKSLSAKKIKIAKRLKREYIGEAYKNFKAACENGHPEGSTFVYMLINNKEYNKHLKINGSASVLGDCGI